MGKELNWTEPTGRQKKEIKEINKCKLAEKALTSIAAFIVNDLKTSSKRQKLVSRLKNMWQLYNVYEELIR